MVVTYKNGRAKTEIPYYATIKKGTILMNTSATTYFKHDANRDSFSREVIVMSEFDDPLVITGIEVDEDVENYFGVSKKCLVFLNNPAFDENITRLIRAWCLKEIK